MRAAAAPTARCARWPASRRRSPPDRSGAEPRCEHLADGVDGLRRLETLVAERLPGAEIDHRADDRAVLGPDAGRIEQGGEGGLERLPDRSGARVGIRLL